MHLMKLFCRFQEDTGGVAAMEYSLIAGFISLVIVAGLLIATPAISLIYSTIGSSQQRLRQYGRVQLLRAKGNRLSLSPASAPLPENNRVTHGTRSSALTGGAFLCVSRRHSEV